MQRHEVDGAAAGRGPASERSKALLDAKAIDVTLQIGLQKDKALAEVR